MEQNDSRIILIDADVVSHFITAGHGMDLNKIFPNKICILDKVNAELQRWPSAKIKQQISLLFTDGSLELIDFPEENEAIKKEYHWIKSKMFKGDGESACLAVARHNKQILASSNLKDTKHYCDMHRIDYLTTMDFLCRALNTGFFSETQCNQFITAVLNAKSRLPVKSMTEYRCRELSFI